MPDPKFITPGVLLNKASSLFPAVSEVGTAIPAFIGYTEKAARMKDGDLKNIAFKISSLADFETVYGGPPTEPDNSVSIGVKDHGNNQYDIMIQSVVTKLPRNSLYYSIRHFYDNGGGACYVISVGNYKDIHSASALIKGLDVVKEVDEVTLLIIPESNKLDKPGYKSIVQAMIGQAAGLGDRFALIDVFGGTAEDGANASGNPVNGIEITRDAVPLSESNSFGAAYYPNLVSEYNFKFDFDNLQVASYSYDGPGSPTDIMGKKMSQLGQDSLIYKKIQSEFQKTYVVLPPSSAVAGLYRHVDTGKGVWAAPVGALSALLQPSLTISDADQQNLNADVVSGISINAIRSFPGQGTLVWGARTLSGNDNDWRYVNVRRFCIMVEESIKKSIQWVASEPNSVSNWTKIKSMIENYLSLKWKEGALLGSKPEEAYFVQVGLGTTMTSLDISEGRMNIEIGVAVIHPAEFIILKITQMMQPS